MNKANIFLLTILLILVGVFALKTLNIGGLFDRKGGETPIVNVPNGPIGQEPGDTHGFTLTKEYLGENRWEFVVKGNLATPCHGLDLDVLVRESFPEQVEVVATITRPREGACAQVVTPVEGEGTFQASERATVNLSLIEED